MSSLALHEYHQKLSAHFASQNGQETVAHYGDALAEYTALRESVGLADLCYRGRLCLLGADRQRFLNGQVTNDVAALKADQGCYGALITAKGKMLSDLNIYSLENEILLDFEPGLSAAIAQRLEKYVIADDVQIVDVAPHYGLLSVQGSKANEVLANLGIGFELPAQLMSFVKWSGLGGGEIYVMNQPRATASGFDLFVPMANLELLWEKLLNAAKTVGGRPCGWDAMQMVRIEAGVPRFGSDMDETNLPPEAGLEKRAISYTKGCYIGQEVIARIRTYGQVAKALRGLRLDDDLKTLPKKGDKLFKAGKELGYITSAMHSPALKANIALGYVRRESNQIGSELSLSPNETKPVVKVVELPFRA